MKGHKPARYLKCKCGAQDWHYEGGLLNRYTCRHCRRQLVFSGSKRSGK